VGSIARPSGSLNQDGSQRVTQVDGVADIERDLSSPPAVQSGGELVPDGEPESGRNAVDLPANFPAQQPETVEDTSPDYSVDYGLDPGPRVVQNLYTDWDTWAHDESSYYIVIPQEEAPLQWERNERDTTSGVDWPAMLEGDDIKPLKGDECSICLEGADESAQNGEQNEPGDEWMSLECGHKFHSSCLQVWFTQQLNRYPPIMSCPCCRKPLNLSENIIR